MKNTRRQAIPILATLNALNKKFGKLYCYPSQIKIMDLLSLYHDINIGIATLNRWLRDLEDNRYIVRVRRIKNDKRRGIMFKSTLYKITLPGYQVLKMAGVSVWKEIQAITAAGLRAGQRALSRFRGPVSLKTILAAPLIFGVKNKTYILDE